MTTGGRDRLNSTFPVFCQLSSVGTCIRDLQLTNTRVGSRSLFCDFSRALSDLMRTTFTAVTLKVRSIIIILSRLSEALGKSALTDSR